MRKHLYVKCGGPLIRAQQLNQTVFTWTVAAIFIDHDRMLAVNRNASPLGLVGTTYLMFMRGQCSVYGILTILIDIMQGQSQSPFLTCVHATRISHRFVANGPGIVPVSHQGRIY